MAATAPAPETRRSEWFATLVTLALVMGLAWQLAHWTWVFVAPAPGATAPPASPALNLPAIARLFGAAPPAGNPALVSSGTLRLKGVIAPDAGPAASAIFSTGGGKDIAVFVDRDVQPGVKLVEVKPEYAVVSRGGVRERIELEAPRPAVKSAAARNAGFRLNVAKSGANNYSISRKELDEALKDPNQLGYLGQIGVPPGGGVRMDAAPTGSLAAKLGLQSGDIIRKVNGQAVASTGDLARLYQQFATTSLIQAEVQRGTTTVQLSYAIQP
ncbi:MAG TPA: type II secretion system protein N [Usitatibacter sp.]|nr:type II secretion system protein N [Usitatibacter sp.]